MGERTAGSGVRRSLDRLTRWVLLTGNRLWVSLVMLLGIGATFFAVGILDIATVTKGSRVMWYLNGTVNGLLTLIPIAVGVNQIVLTHEFGSIEDLYERRNKITDFRERVEDQTDTAVTSPHVATFFGTILSAISDAGRTLRSRGDRPADDGLADEIGAVAESISEEAERVNDELAATDTGMLRTLIVVLGYDNSQQFYEVRRLRKELADGPGDPPDELEHVQELFVELDAGRQFLKTVVVERQLAHLSRLLIGTGIPAVTVAAVGIFVYRDIAGVTVPHAVLVVIAGTLVVATLVPLAILSAYILRVATIARQTASYGPFVPESGE